MKRLSQKDISELLSILENKRKLKVLKDFITNKYIFIPLCMVLVYLIDNPNIMIIDFLKKEILKIT